MNSSPGRGRRRGGRGRACDQRFDSQPKSEVKNENDDQQWPSTSGQAATPVPPVSNSQSTAPPRISYARACGSKQESQREVRKTPPPTPQSQRRPSISATVPYRNAVQTDKIDTPSPKSYANASQSNFSQGRGGGRGSNSGRNPNHSNGRWGKNKSDIKFVQPTSRHKRNGPSCSWLDTKPDDTRGYFGSTKEEVELPKRKGQSEICASKERVKVNHFEGRINLQEIYYCYDLKIEWTMKKENSDVRRLLKQKAILCAVHGVNSRGESCPGFMGIRDEYMRKSGAKDVGIVTDFSTAIYSTHKLEEYAKMSYEISETWASPEEADSSKPQFVTVNLVDPTPVYTSKAGDINNMKGRNVNSSMKKLERLFSIAFRNVETTTYTPVGRSSLINFAGSGSPLGGGIVNYSGYNVILPICNGWRPYLNIDIANSATVMGKNVLEVIADVCTTGHNKCTANDCGHLRDIHPESLEKASALVRTCRIQYFPTSSKRMHGVAIGISSKSVSDEKFEMTNSNGKSVMKSVCQYFLETYKLKLKYPNGPCLELRGNKFVPAEICTIIKGQSYNRKLDPEQTTRMLACAKKDPNVLQAEIENAVVALKLKNNPILHSFNIQLKNDLLELEARVLPAPKLQYGKQNGSSSNANGVFQPVDGTWDINANNLEFLKPARVRKWGLLLLCRVEKQEYIDFADMLVRKATKFGMTFPKNYECFEDTALRDDPKHLNKNITAVKKHLEHFKGCDIVLVIIAKKSDALYNHVKQAAELYSGILTQCAIKKNIVANPRRDSVITHMIQKMNAKLNGVNHIIYPDDCYLHAYQIMNEHTLIIGADVTHPPPLLVRDENTVQPSYAAVTGSVDPDGMVYMMNCQAQEKAGKGAAECIFSLSDTIFSFLQIYEEKNDHRPTRILYFRDGVGDGQFGEIVHVEMGAIRAACIRLGGESYQPKITLITVQKRHKTRMFKQCSGGKPVNVAPGTVVDTEIVHPSEQDFYMVSQKGMLGTSRPTRYHVLWDDSEFSPAQIEMLCYHLCYQYIRCNKSVKIPAPTYYAHFAAARAKALADGLKTHGTPAEQIQQINSVLKGKMLTQFSKEFPFFFV